MNKIREELETGIRYAQEQERERAKMNLTTPPAQPPTHDIAECPPDCPCYASFPYSLTWTIIGFALLLIPWIAILGFLFGFFG